MKEDWIECELEEVCNIYAGVGFPKNKQGKIKGDFPFYKVGDISKNVKVGNRYLELCDNYIDKGDIAKIENKLLPPKSIAFAKIGEALKLNRRCITTDYSLVDNNAIGIKANASLTDLFLYFFFLTIQLEKYSRATTVPSVRKSDIESIKFLLPPLVEQKAIVKKIEELFSSLDSGIADLKKAQDQLVIYRQAVLKKAFEGELTKAWREKKTDLPSADALLELLKEERQKHYEKQIANWENRIKHWEGNGRVGKKQTKPKKLSEFTIELEEKILNIPNNWREGFLEYLADAIDPQPSHRTPPKVEGGIPFISIANINKNSGVIDFESARKVGKYVLEDHINRYELNEGDFVIGKIGTIGKPFFIPTDRTFTLSANVVLVQPFKTCNSKFLFYLNISPIIEQQFKKGAKATTQAAFGIKKVRLLRVPLCSIKEQHQIVQEIESRLSVCDKVEESIKESLQKAKALRQSILKKAFEGTLLSEAEIAKCKAHKDFEPASVLLGRIKMEKNN